MKTYSFPALPWRNRYADNTPEQTAAYNAAKQARFDVLATLCLDASPLLNEPQEGRYAGILSFSLAGKADTFHSTYVLTLKALETGQIEARLTCYGSNVSFRRFAVKDGLISVRALEGLRELAEQGRDLAQLSAESAKENAEQAAIRDNGLAANLAIANEAGLIVAKTHEWSKSANVKVGLLAVDVTAHGFTLSSSTLPMDKLAAVLAFAKALE